MKTVLAVDTSAQVAVGIAQVDDPSQPGEVLVQVSDMRPNHHVEQLTPLMQQALQEANLEYQQIDEIVTGLGPGPFTGLRVGIVTAAVLASALRKPMHGVCSLDAVACQIASQMDAGAQFISCLDARRREIYWAQYRIEENGIPVRINAPQVGAAETLPAGIPVLGPGTLTRLDLFNPIYPIDRVDAGVLAAWAHLMPDAGIEPMYLRKPDATVSTKRKSALTPQERK